MRIRGLYLRKRCGWHAFGEELMKLHNGSMVLFGRFSFLSALRAVVIAMLLLGLPINPGKAHAVPAAPSAHVFLVRGVLNIFSLGMDQLANRLQQQGITATVHNHMLWASIADEAAAEYKSGRVKTIILVGHSSGATVLPDIVARLDRQGVPVKLAIGLDSVFHTSLTGRVGRYINFYVANGAGTRVQTTKGFHGTLENVDVERVPGVSHLTIDKNELMQQKVMAEIDAAVRSGPSRMPVEKRQQQPVASVTPHGSPAKRSAAAAAN
jgi:creatinine amidohydrolase/Fe(II)-dependent formamide hydrolase-like protein